MRNNSEKNASVNNWLDFKSGIEKMLQCGTPENQLEVLIELHDAYKQAGFDKLSPEQRKESLEFGIFKDILNKSQKHTFLFTKELTALAS